MQGITFSRLKKHSGSIFPGSLVTFDSVLSESMSQHVAEDIL